ncbi:hypothetical protein [Armatimonas rosea]|uniref:Glycosyltransferase RgtA/B/C/D-like domain-containing protein n=1 Tax=Armatimonas rosea TaxID=685828 RepID=A0A7W9SVN2_ARMRO|nr:hypothetical protein [Armatimonas rosea]MBB6053200.1 hypothetical protein [Armatimonas rosea]
MLPCPLLTDPLFVSALLWLALALGRRLVRLGKGLSAEPILALALGLGALPYVFFGLGAVGLARPLALVVGLLALALWARRDFLPFPKISLPREPLAWALGVTLVCYLPLAAAPVTDHDGQFYHLTALKRWLGTGRLDYLPTLTMTQWPMGVDMLFGLPLALWSDTAAKLLHFALGALTLVALTTLGTALGNRTAGLLGGAALVLLARGEFCSAYIDLGVAFQVSAALLAFTLALQRDNRQLWLLAALLSGFAGSCKLTMLALGPSLLLASGTRTGRDRVLFLALVLAPALPYFIRAALLTGNPLYPTLAHVFPTRDWPSGQSEIFMAFNQLYNWGSSQSWDATTRQGIRGVLIALTLLSFGLWRSASVVERRLAGSVLGVLALTLWLVGPYPRYLIPSLPVLALLAVLRLQHVRPLAAVAALLALLVGAQALRDVPRALPAIIGGREERERFLRRELPLYPALAWINQNTAPTARILLVADTAYYCDRPCWLPHPYLQGAIRLVRYEDFVSDVRKAGITHLVVGSAPQPAPSLFPTENQVRFSQRLAQERGTRVFQANQVEVWELR